MFNFYSYNLNLFLHSPHFWILLIFGLIMGSFFNVCVLRIPKGEFLNQKRSHCPSCGALIPALLNIPVFSYVFLRGRSACCHKKISMQYPIVEVLTAVLFLFLYLEHPFWGFQSLASKNFYTTEFIRFIHAISFVSLLLICSVIDFNLKIIPDVISLPMIVLSILWVWIHPELDARSSFYGVLLGGGIIYAIAWTYYLLRKQEGIGMGDAKLLAGIGGWLGYQSILPTLLYGSILGSIFGSLVLILSRRFNLKTEIPFGPFLAIGAIIHMYYGVSLWHSFTLL